MGQGEDDGRPHPVARQAPRSAQYDAYRDRQEERARLAVWMNGNAPHWNWEEYESGMLVFAMTFPGTSHERVWVFEHPQEFGRVLVWCYGCSDSRCTACVYARAEFLTQHTARRREAERRARDANAPF